MSKTLMDRQEFDNSKFVQFDDIPYVKDMECPECHGCAVDSFGEVPYARPIGWCDTVHGIMAVFECPKCFTKFRCHIDSTGRNNVESFFTDYELLYYLYYNRKT